MHSALSGADNVRLIAGRTRYKEVRPAWSAYVPRSDHSTRIGRPQAACPAGSALAGIEHTTYTYSNVSGILQNTGSEVMVRFCCTVTAR